MHGCGKVWTIQFLYNDSLKAFRSNQRSTFDEILRKIDQNCSIEEALKPIVLAVKERDDEAFQWMSWLRHLPQQGVDIIDF